MSRREDKAAMKELLNGRSDDEVRALCIDVLRTWRKTHRAQPDFSLHGDLGQALYPKLMQLRGAAPFPFSGAAPAAALEDSIAEAGMESISEFVNWFTRAGFAWPLSAPPNQYPIRLHLTRLGCRFLDADEDHPLVPGFVDRIVARCPKLPDDVQSLLIDARSCLDHELVRPAIQLIGVAYELALDHVVESMVARTVLPQSATELRAARRIGAIRAKIDMVMPASTIQEKETRGAVHASYDFADQLRQRRNDAAHTSPKYDFDNRSEGEEFLVSAGRHLPHLWRMY
jgi:hypothetical protein